MENELEQIMISLRNKLEVSFLEQGFSFNKVENNGLFSKESYKNLQNISKLEQLKNHKNFLIKNFDKVRKKTISGSELNPLNINLELREVCSNTFEEVLFKWWNLIWWSMPYQRSYGRQMRFILWDKYHDVPFGLISLQSPILKQAVRDKALQLPIDQLDYWVNRSMYAQRVGALPPYNELIGGKMVALSLCSNEIKNKYNEKYSDRLSLIKKRNIESDLLFITTTSAFGKSSIYNRINLRGTLVAKRLGYTNGFGTFQISDSLYEELIDFLNLIGEDTERCYGNGPSRKMKLIGKACRKLNVKNYTYHGLKREYYLFSLVENLLEVIHKNEEPVWINYSFQELFEYWQNRWLIKRIVSNKKWIDYDKNTYLDEVKSIIDKL